jgi:hypothetical protein
MYAYWQTHAKLIANGIRHGPGGIRVRVTSQDAVTVAPSGDDHYHWPSHESCPLSLGWHAIGLAGTPSPVARSRVTDS